MTKKLLLVKLVEAIFKAFTSLVSKTSMWFLFSSSVISEVRRKTVSTVLPTGSLNFHAPNDRCLYRANSLFTKEPETIDWIDGFEEGSVFWDVGACVGTYTVYAGVKKKVRVIAVEPSVFNLEWLTKNVNANNLASQVTIVPLALTTKAHIADFGMQVTEWGGSLSSFSVTYDHEGNQFSPRFSYSTIGCSVDFLIDQFGLPKPDYVKIDVDSIEHLVIGGMQGALPSIRSIALENSRNKEVTHRCTELLIAYGFVVSHVGRANSIWNRLTAAEVQL